MREHLPDLPAVARDLGVVEQHRAQQLDRQVFVSVDLPLVTTYQQQALQALGDPTRREIFERLTAGPLAVGQLAQEVPVSRPAVSQHLKVLKEAALVSDRAVGNRRIYQLDPDGLAAVRAYFDSFWNRALPAYKAAVERKAKETA